MKTCGGSGHVWQGQWPSCPSLSSGTQPRRGLCSLGCESESPCDTALGTGQVANSTVTRRLGCCYGDGDGGPLPSARFLHGSSNDRPEGPGSWLPWQHRPSQEPGGPGRRSRRSRTPGLLGAGSVGGDGAAGSRLGREKHSQLGPDYSDAVPRCRRQGRPVRLGASTPAQRSTAWTGSRRVLTTLEPRDGPAPTTGGLTVGKGPRRGSRAC